MRLRPGHVVAYVFAVLLSSIGAPARGEAPPARQRDPTAHCSDGTYYYGPKNRRLACAHHRGVAEWLAPSPRTSSSRRARAAARRRTARTPPGATARCRDGSYSMVRDRAHACAGHRGIARWLRAR
jgi:hypothetical protein